LIDELLEAQDQDEKDKSP